MRKVLTLALAITAFAAIAGTATASHSWGGYHWARTANPFTIKVIDANTSAWDSHLNKAIADWNNAAVSPPWEGPIVLKVVKEELGVEDKRCRPVAGKVKSCNGAYGKNGWLGLAQIWVSGVHISQGTAKMNDSYLSAASYTETKRQHVICQEIGHTWGLGHQDELGKDLGTCMDYATALDNPGPNYHDFEQLAAIYRLPDSSTTIATGLAGNGSAKPVRVERNDRIAASIITEHFRDGSQRITHVFWALETRGHAAEQAVGQDD